MEIPAQYYHRLTTRGLQKLPFLAFNRPFAERDATCVPEVFKQD